MKKFLFSLSAALLCICMSGAPKTYNLSSPDGKLAAMISVDGKLVYSLDYAGSPLVKPSEIAMKLSDGAVLGSGKPAKAEKRSFNGTINATFYRKSVIYDNYNELKLKYKGWSVTFRAYDDGFAWRFATEKRKAACTVESETATFTFPDNWNTIIPFVRTDNPKDNQFANSFENVYTTCPLKEMPSWRIAFNPTMICRPDGVKACIMESDRLSYPGMYVGNPDGSCTLKGIFAPYPKKMEQGGHNNLQMLVKSAEDYIARMDGSARDFPWRIIAVSAEDRKMAGSDIVYRLASPADPGADWSWVKPGKVAWDWWNDWNIKNVDFRAGINNDTYKYYIDFASKNGIEYVILDEGWAVNLKCDLFQVVPEIDLRELCAYAESKHVGLILWAGHWAFERDMEKVCQHYSKMGIKGYKVDFMNRDDQIVEDFLENAAKTCAKYHQVLDFHGIHEPTGLQRKYPNILNYEGVFGLEQLKWAPSSVDMVTFDVQIPFIRLVAGYADYTQGAMKNANKANYRPVYSEPMSQGTRCHQLAEYVVFDAPLNMLCDSPSNYIAEQECTSFIAGIPTVWDENYVLDGKVGEYIVTAKKKDGKWYVGALNNWTERDIEIDLGTIVGGNVVMDAFMDGINADRIASDYARRTVKTDARGRVKIHLAPGGGFIACTK